MSEVFGGVERSGRPVEFAPYHGGFIVNDEHSVPHALRSRKIYVYAPISHAYVSTRMRSCARITFSLVVGV